MNIQILEIRLIEPKESGLRGFCDIRVDAVTIRDFRIFQRNGKPYVQAPYTTLKKDGALQFHPIIDLPGELRAQVDTAILTAYFGEKENRDANEKR
jgi:DNA-binding cell septation regulator SpoVG